MGMPANVLYSEKGQCVVPEGTHRKSPTGLRSQTSNVHLPSLETTCFFSRLAWLYKSNTHSAVLSLIDIAHATAATGVYAWHRKPRLHSPRTPRAIAVFDIELQRPVRY